MTPILLVWFYILNLTTTCSATDLFTTWTAGSPPMPYPVRAQATGYDPYTGIIYLVGGAVWHNTKYLTYNTITKEMSSIQTIPNGGATDSWMAQYYVQIHRTMYMYDEPAQCIDTFNMETLVWTSCWAHFPSIPTLSNAGCMTIDDTGRYFYIIPETKEFFFFDSVEKAWYFGPDTIQTAHLFAGCDVFDNKLYYFGGQVCWGHSCAGLRTIEYLDISDMDALKQNPSTFSWNTMTNFLPVSPEADFVRSVQLNDIIYTVTGYRYYGDGTNIDVMGIDLANSAVDVLTEIPTVGIGGSLVWDPCQMQLYYFGGFDGSTDMTTWYYSNTVSNVHLPSKYQMDCMLPSFTTSTTAPTTSTTTTDSPTTTAVQTTSSSVTDLFTTWTMGTPSMPEPLRAQATGYDPYTGIIYLVGGTWHNTQYLTYNTITKEMSPFQTIPNGGATDSWMAQYYVQIHRTMYMYDEPAQCIDTFNMETLIWTSCWAHFPSIPTLSNAGCMTIDDTGRYFYIIPETKEFFFFDSVEKAWYFGPDTVQTAHLYPGCDVFDNKLYYFGGQVCWGHSCAGLRTIEYLDISDMDALKQNPSTFSWNTMSNFLPVTPEADFVRFIQLNEIVYTVTGYRYYGDGTNIDVMGIDFANNVVGVLTEIPTVGIGGSLVWDPCQMQLYYFGGFDGSTDMTTWYYSNTVSNVYLPSKYQMDCKLSSATKLPSTTDTLTSTAAQTTSTLTTESISTPLEHTTKAVSDTTSSASIKTTPWNEEKPLDTPPIGLETPQLVLIIICVFVCCGVLLLSAYCCGRKYNKKPDDKKASLSDLAGIGVVTRNVKLHMHVDSEPTAPPVDDIKNTEDMQHWIETIVGLGQYTECLFANGYDSLDIMMDIADRKELEDIGIVLKGHQTRIMKQISALQKQHWTCLKCNVRNKNTVNQCKGCQHVKEQTVAGAAEGTVTSRKYDINSEGPFGPGYDAENGYTEGDVLLS